MSFQDYRRGWEDLGQVDPFWAVLTEPARRHGRWEPGQFFATGEAEIAALMKQADELHLPQERKLALDFRCGIGRVARALASRFENYVGVDISQAMIAQAQQWNSDCSRCRFILNTTEDLRSFDDGSVDLVHAGRVLQHLPSETIVHGYISEFVRILKPGGLLVFQLPSDMSLLHLLQPRRRLYSFMRRLGVSERFLLGPVGLSPMVMRAMAEPKIMRLIASLGARLLRSDRRSAMDHTYFVTH